MLIRTLCLLILYSCSQVVTSRQEILQDIQLIEVDPNKQTAVGRQNIEHLLKVYDLKTIIYQKNIHIQSQHPLRSHPELIINTRYNSNPKMMLFMLLHLQSSYHPLFRSKSYKEISSELNSIHDLGQHSSKRTILQIYITLLNMQKTLGKSDTKALLKELELNEPHLSRVYQLVIRNSKPISDLLKKYRTKI